MVKTCSGLQLVFVSKAMVTQSSVKTLGCGIVPHLPRHWVSIMAPMAFHRNAIDANSNFYNTKTRFFHIFYYYTPFQTAPLAGRFIKASSCLKYLIISKCKIYALVVEQVDTQDGRQSGTFKIGSAPILLTIKILYGQPCTSSSLVQSTKR